MPVRGEQGGAGSEATRLLQEGLQLLAERAREVDAIVAHARDRARQHIEEAEQRAAQITAVAEQTARDIAAEAERSRAAMLAELDALRTEIAEARRELGLLEPGHRDAVAPGAAVLAGAEVAGNETSRLDDVAGSSARAPAGAEASDAANDAPEAADEPEPTDQPEPVVEVPEVAAGGQRRRRPSGFPAAQATPLRAGRPHWLSRWLPFVLLSLAGVAVVMATVGGQAGAGQAGDPPTIVVTFTPPTAATAKDGSPFGVATATTVASSGLTAARGAAQPPPVQTPRSAPTRSAGLQTTITAGAVQPGSTPVVTATVSQANRTSGPASQRLPGTSPIPPLDTSTPDAAVLGAYTAYSSYTVQPGDTLNKVADDLGVSRDSIISASHLMDPNLLQPGQVLTIPHDTGWLYRVQPADTLEQIARRFGVTVDALVTASALPSPVVHAGDLLLIPSLASRGPKE